MLDIKIIRENKEMVGKNNATRNVNVDLDQLLKLDEEKSEILKKVELLRAKRNQTSKSKPTPDEIAAMKKVGEEISKLDEELKAKDAELHSLLIKIPNINDPSTPIGKDDTENQVEKTVGKKRDFSFKPKEHFEVSAVLSGIDMERGAKVSGSRFYYLKGKIAHLERAIMQYAVDFMSKKGFQLVLPPVLVKEEAMFGTGFFPADKNEVYNVNPTEDNLYLVGTSEVSLVYMHTGEVFEESELPKKYVAITPCFRRESGSYGKDTKGLFRVHQFFKTEMVVFCTPEQSAKIHEELLSYEEEFINSLGIHYQVVNVCSGDLGYPATKKYDCEGWFPGQGRYRELTSTSNTSDYQARRSNIKMKTSDGKRVFAHTLNGTVSSDRPMLAIIENNQQEDGSIIIPEVLKKYLGFDKI
jgi:seryl-tRNA synthetase